MENYTQIPNVIIDEWMRNMNASSFTVLMAICRKTLGWQKESDYISQSQIMGITGLSKNSVIRALKELKDKELINIIERPGITSNYTLNLTSARSEPVPEVNRSGAKNEPVYPLTSAKSEHTKETLIKETIIKEKENELFNVIKKIFYEIYKELYGQKPDYAKKDFGIMKNIAKLALQKENPELTISNKFEVFKNKCIKDKNKFWVFTPAKFKYGWNDFIINPIEQETDLDFINNIDFRNKK
jgi:phage replication O-like protein O